jgi:regulator of protease activity HflC (stomatin/prohibitin superfamily)
MPEHESHDLVPADDSGAGMDVELLAAALRRDTADLDLYAKVLSVTLVDSLPPGAVRIERKRTMADRMAGREGAVTNIDVALGDQRLGLRLDRGRMTCEVCKEVRGIVLSRQQVGLDEWIDTLARALAETAASSARAREALERFLS